MLKRILGSFFAIACLAVMPASAADFSLDGFLRGQCGTVTAASNAATLANKCGTVTSETLATALGSSYTLTLTNTTVAAADLILWSVDNGNNTTGALIPSRATAAAGSIVFIVRNPKDGPNGGDPAAWSGNIKIKYFVIKP